MMQPQYLKYFTPSLLRLPDEARERIGAAGLLAERAALRRVWEIGLTSYQVVALAVPVPGGATADMLVRRRHTLEVGAVIESGPIAPALQRAVSWLEAFRGDPQELQALFAEYEKRGLNAGMPIAKEMRQAFVLAPRALYDAAMQDKATLAAIEELRLKMSPGELGFRFFAAEEVPGDLRVGIAPEPFGGELSLVRSVSGLMH